MRKIMGAVENPDFSEKPGFSHAAKSNGAEVTPCAIPFAFDLSRPGRMVAAGLGDLREIAAVNVYHPNVELTAAR